MRRMLASFILVSVWLLADPASARSQVYWGPVGYTGWGYRGGAGFAFGNRHFHFSGFYAGGYGAIAPVWGPVGVGPWGPYSYWTPTPVWGPPFWAPPVWGWGAPAWGWGQPVVVAPPPIVIVQANPLSGYSPNTNGGFGFAARPPFNEPAGVREPKVDEAVQRGDLLVVRPKGLGIQAAGGFPALKPAPREEGFGRQPQNPPAEEAASDAKKRVVQEVARAREAFQAGQYGRATERLAEAIRATPQDALPHFLLAQTQVARGEYAEAVAAIREGMRRAPDWPTASFNLKEFYGANGDRFREHLEALKKAAASDPTDPTVSFLLGYHLWFLGDKAEATKLFKKATKQVTDNGIIERFLVEAESKNG